MPTKPKDSKKLFGRDKKKQTFVLPEGYKFAGVFYIRVSTIKQEAKGNGLEAQRAAILEFASREKIYQVGDFYVEALSGKLEDRPKLLAAFALAEEHNAYVVTSKLDRLSRDSLFINELIAKNFKFVTVQYGFAYEPLMLRVIAAFNQDERERTVQRTKDALAQKKQRLEEEYQRELLTNPNAVRRRLGIPAESINDSHISRVSQREAIEDAVHQWVEYIKPTMDELELESGRKPSMVKVVERMNSKGLKNKHGNAWTPSIMYHLVKRLKESGEYDRLNPVEDDPSEPESSENGSFDARS